jgi:uncharacterized membrane protein YhdT
MVVFGSWFVAAVVLPVLFVVLLWSLTTQLRYLAAFLLQLASYRSQSGSFKFSKMKNAFKYLKMLVLH